MKSETPKEFGSSEPAESLDASSWINLGNVFAFFLPAGLAAVLCYLRGGLIAVFSDFEIELSQMSEAALHPAAVCLFVVLAEAVIVTEFFASDVSSKKTINLLVIAISLLLGAIVAWALIDPTLILVRGLTG